MAGKRVKKVKNAKMYDRVETDKDLKVPQSIKSQYPHLEWRYKYRHYYDFNASKYIEEWALVSMAKLFSHTTYMIKPSQEMLEASARAQALNILNEVKNECEK